MGRPRTFDEDDVIARATDAFVRHGYAATSVDDLVMALEIHRGSIYKAFGSKRSLFVRAVEHCVSISLPAAVDAGRNLSTEPTLDLILIAAVELAPHDPEIRNQIDLSDALLRPIAATLGNRLWNRAHP